MFIGEKTYSFDNFLEVTLSAGHDIVTTGDVDIYLSELPDGDNGLLVLDSANETKKEIVYYHSKSGTYVSVKAINRGLGGTTATTHTAGVAVQCNVVGEMFDAAYKILKRITGGYVSKLTSSTLYVYITEWSGYIGGTYYTYAGSGISGQLLVDDSTIYIYLDSTGSLVVNLTGFPTDGSAYIMLATVVTASGSVSTIDNLDSKKLDWHDGITPGMVTADISGTDYLKKKIVAGNYVTLSIDGDKIEISATPGTGTPNNWTNVTADLLPDVTNTRDIGSSTLKFKDLFLEGNITFGGSITGNVVSSINSETGAITLAEGDGINIAESSGTFTYSVNPLMVQVFS